MDCAILSLQSALEDVNNPDTLVKLRLKHPTASEEVLLANLAKSRADYEQAIELLQACNALAVLADEEDDEIEVALDTSQSKPLGDWN